MSFWEKFHEELGPAWMAEGDQYDAEGEAFLDKLILDVRKFESEAGFYPIPALLGGELMMGIAGDEDYYVKVLLALGAAMVRLAKLPDDPDGLTGLDFEADE